MSEYREQIAYNGEYMKVSENVPGAVPGGKQQLERGVYVGLTGLAGDYTSRGLSTREARAAGETLIKIADRIEAAAKNRIPEEPNGGLVILKFPNKIPVYRPMARSRWRFTNSDSNTSFTWEELCDHLRATNYVGVNDPLAYEILYEL